MASDTRNVKMGVCQVFFDGADLGYTKGGVEVSVSTETHEVEIDQFGKSPVNEIIMGRTASAKIPLAETTLENLVAIMPGATLVTDGTDATVKRVDVTNAVGTDLLEIAKPLILHPQAKDASDRSDDFILVLAGTGGALTYAYKLEEERIFNVEFKGYPSSATKRLFAVGDIAANAKAATVDATADEVTITAHGLVDGQGLMLLADTYPDFTGAAYGKLYFVHVKDVDTVTLHATPTDAKNNADKLVCTAAGTNVKAFGI